MTSLTSKCKRNNTWDVFLSCLLFFFLAVGGWLGWGEAFQLLDVLYFYLNLVSTSQFPSDSGANSSAHSQGRDLITCWGKCRWAPVWSLSTLSWCGPRVCPVVPAFALRCGSGCLTGGARGEGWRGHLLRSVLAGTGPCWETEREGVVLFPQDYLYPALVQSGRFVDGKQALVEEKVLPDQMLSAFCSSSLIAAMCERVWGTAFLSWGSRLKLSLGRLATFCKEQISVSQVWKNNVPGHEYHLPHGSRVGGQEEGHDQRPPGGQMRGRRPGLR